MFVVNVIFANPCYFYIYPPTQLFGNGKHMETIWSIDSVDMGNEEVPLFLSIAIFLQPKVDPGCWFDSQIEHGMMLQASFPRKGKTLRWSP